MRIFYPAYYLIGLCLLISAGLSVALTPKVLPTNQAISMKLDNIIPTQFGNWKEETGIVPIMVNPAVETQLNKIYSQTLSRTYVNQNGEHIMLSIAYGGVQNSAMHAHRPEVCYLAQGFQVGALSKGYVDTPIARIPVMRLDAKEGARNEPITYWIRVGDYITRGLIEQNLVQLRYGLTGAWRDGLLVRVSIISNDVQGSYQVEQKFISAMLQAVPEKERFMLIGKLAS